jgi:hypothetical protein
MRSEAPIRCHNYGVGVGVGPLNSHLDRSRTSPRWLTIDDLVLVSPPFGKSVAHGTATSAVMV